MIPMDLEQIDLLVRERFYQNRADFIRTAIRTRIGAHVDTARQAVACKDLALGLQNHTRRDPEAMRAASEALEIRMLGPASTSCCLIHHLSDSAATPSSSATFETDLFEER